MPAVKGEGHELHAAYRGAKRVVSAEISTKRIRAVVEARYADLSRERAQANDEAQRWRESEKRYALMRESERRAEWADYHRSQAQRIRATSAALIDYHEGRAALLEAPLTTKRRQR